MVGRSPEEAARRGKAAKALLDDPLMVEAREQVRAQIIAAWEGLPDGAREQREQLWWLQKAHAALFGHLENVIVEGQLNDPDLAEAARKAATPP